jgi:hypothetical protein
MTRFPVLVSIALALAGLTASGERSASTPREHVPSLPSSSGEPSVEPERAALPAPAPVEIAAAEPEVVESADQLTAPTPELYEASGLRLRRLVLGRGVEAREPVETGVLFPAEERPLYAFVDVANETDEDRQLRVIFERPDGQSVGLVELTVPPNVPRWRTWALSRMVTQPGDWIAHVETEEGDVLGRLEFTVEPIS